MIEYKSVAEFVDLYDAFILDIWGVIHDGESAYPGVLETMRKLKQAGKEIIFLSNAPRRSSKVKKALARFGVTEDLYKDAVSSGEVAYQLFSRYCHSSESWNPAAPLDPGLRRDDNIPYFYIGPEKDADLLQGLNYQIVQKAADAKFVLATGFDNDDSTLQEKLPQIKEAMKADLKMYCVNPDLIVVRQNGTKMLCAGVIGEYYRDQGWEVEFIGKPYKQVYEYIQKSFAPGARIAAIGDSLTTDIAGANNVGIDSILVLGGILQMEKEPLETLIKKTHAKPNATIPAFTY